MAITAQSLKDCFNEFDELDPAILTKAIAHADRLVSAVQWGAKADDARLFLAAHITKVFTDEDGLAPGALTSYRVDDVAGTFAIGRVVTESVLGSTGYGRHYLFLLSTLFVTRKV